MTLPSAVNNNDATSATTFVIIIIMASDVRNNVKLNKRIHVFLKIVKKIREGLRVPGANLGG